MKVYLLSGLGADERAFEHIVLPSQFDTFFLPWIEPFKIESLESYSNRISEKINLTEPFGVIGISFGGMLAVEIAKAKGAQFVILISSTPVYTGIPKYMRVLGNLKFHKLIPFKAIGKAGIASFIFGTSTKSESNLIKRFIEKTPPSFLKWALDAIFRWKNKIIPNNLFHIHGSSDTLLPVEKLNPDAIVNKGGHMMVYSRGKEISLKIQEFLLKLNTHV